MKIKYKLIHKKIKTPPQILRNSSHYELLLQLENVKGYIIIKIQNKLNQNELKISQSQV